MTKTTKIIPIIFLNAILIGLVFTAVSIQDIKPANAQIAGETLFVSTFDCVLPPPTACLAPSDIFAIDLISGVVTPFPLPVGGLQLPEDGAVSPTTGQVYFTENCSLVLCGTDATSGLPILGRINLFNTDGSGFTNVLSSDTLKPEGLSFDAAGNLYFNTRAVLLTSNGRRKYDLLENKKKEEEISCFLEFLHYHSLQMEVH